MDKRQREKGPTITYKRQREKTCKDIKTDKYLRRKEVLYLRSLSISRPNNVTEFYTYAASILPLPGTSTKYKQLNVSSFLCLFFLFSNCRSS